jgi:hypothetical protein
MKHHDGVFLSTINLDSLKLGYLYCNICYWLWNVRSILALVLYTVLTVVFYRGAPPDPTLSLPANI